MKEALDKYPELAEFLEKLGTNAAISLVATGLEGDPDWLTDMISESNDGISPLSKFYQKDYHPVLKLYGIEDLEKIDKQYREYLKDQQSPKVTVQQFENELIQFIRNHRYLKEQDTKAEVDISDPDAPKIQIHTVDGDYERIIIKIIYVA